MRDFVYGGVDGCITTMSIVAASSAIGLSRDIVRRLGMANLWSDGFSMAVARFLSHPEPHFRLQSSLLTYVGFLAAGFTPLLTYTESSSLAYSALASCLVFIALGIVKTWHDKTSVWASVLETVVIGVVGALIAYVVAQKSSDDSART